MKGNRMKFLGMEQMKINLSRMIAAVVGVFSLFVMETFGESSIRKQSPSELFSLEMVSNEGRITGFISNKSTRAWGVYLPRNGIEGLVSVDISYTTNHVRCVLNKSYVVWENIEHDGKWVCLNRDRIVKFVQEIPCDMLADLSREGGPTLAQCEIGGSLMATIRYVDVEAVKRGDEKVIDASRENRLFESCLMWNVNVVIRSQEGLRGGSGKVDVRTDEGQDSGGPPVNVRQDKFGRAY